jgi:DNA-binding transcriptional LysR family regulator
MEMHQVRYFLAAADKLSFTRAAEACGLSQPALTTAIKKLEAQVQAPLFHREGHKLVLTDVGKRLRPHFEMIIQQTEAVENVARDFRLLNQVPVRLGVMSTIGPMKIAGLVAAFEKRSPGVEVAVRDGAPEALTALLDAGEIDAAILNPLDGITESLNTESLYSEAYFAVFPPAHAAERDRPVTLRELSGRPYVDRLACEMREMVMGVCGDMGVELYARFRSQSEEWAQAMVASGIGFAFMPEYAITHPDVVRRPLVEPAVERRIVMVTKRGRRYSPAMAAFAETVRAHAW